ncbi:MAG: hypothetical protein OXG35_21290 [Acidobacteria bacterium]|nr:hypothetical protein [Acidobacteriota bacterium]
MASRGLQRLFEAAARRGYVPGALANTLTPDSLHLRQASRNELIVSLLARCPAPSGVGHMKMMDRRGDGVPIIRSESRILSGRLPEDTLIDDDELRLVIGTYPGRNDRVPLESVGSTMAASETLSAFAAASSASSAGRSAGASP